MIRCFKYIDCGSPKFYIDWIYCKWRLDRKTCRIKYEHEFIFTISIYYRVFNLEIYWGKIIPKYERRSTKE